MKEHQFIKSIEELTLVLKESNDDLVLGIRKCLAEKDIDLETVIVADWFPDDVSFEYGILVTQQGRVFQFGYDYYDKPMGKGAFSEWHEITNNWQEIPLSQRVNVALKHYVKNT